MNENKKTHSFNKKLLKDLIHKYSYEAIFERREKCYNSEENTKKNTKPMLYKTAKLFRKKKNNKQKEVSLVPFYKTLSSFYQSEKTFNILPLLDHFEKNFMSKKNEKIHHKNDIICKTDRNCSEKKLFKTEISFLNSKNKGKINKYYLRKKNDNKSKVKENNKKDSNNIDVLLLIQSERNQNKANNNNNNQKLNIESYLSKGKTYSNKYQYAKTEQNRNIWDKSSEDYTSYVFDIKLSKYDKSQGFKNYKII